MKPLTTPKRITVYGPSGSGKSTLGRRLGERLGLPVVELDALFHRPNWQPTPDAEFRNKVLSTISSHADGWVCEGNYRAVRSEILPLADTAVWLRLPFRVVYWRLLKRTITRAWRKESLWGTNYESWRMSFLSRDSILLWGITHWRAHHRNMTKTLAEVPHTAFVIELRSTRELEAFMASIEAKKRAQHS